MTTTTRPRLCAALVLAACAGGSSARPPAAEPPRPAATTAGAIDGILAAFDDHAIVAIGEHHRDIAFHAFLRDLIRDPRFAATVDDIVVEFATPLGQDVLDRFVIGEEIHDTQIAAVLRDTTQLLVWDSPVYRQLLDTVRDVNRGLPDGKRLRVVGGDPPIRWSTVRRGADYQPFAARDPDTARVLATEVLARKRRALLVIGGGHLPKEDPLAAARGKPGSPSVSALVEQSHPGQLFVVWTVVGDRPPPLLGWAPRSFQRVAGTPLGRASFGTLGSGGTVTILKAVDGVRVPVEVKPTDQPPTERIVDAVVYVGPSQGTAMPPPKTYADDRYVTELLRRAKIMKEVFGVDFSQDILDVGAAARP